MSDDPDVIMSVQELIDASVGVDTKCVVNFKLMKTLLLILGSQLRILDRNVHINSDDIKVASYMTVSEVTVQTSETKKKKNAVKAVTKSDEGLKSKGKAQERVMEADECRSAPHIDILTEEEKRERELRIIEQRNDSRTEPAKTPTPMASLDSLSKAKIFSVAAQGRAPRLSVVSKEEFEKLSGVVQELKLQLDPKSILNIKNADVIKSIRKGASLPDAMAALSTSSRLEAFNKALEMTFSLMTELAKGTPGVDIAQFKAAEKDFKTKGEVNAMPPKEKGTHDSFVRVKDEKNCVTAIELQHAIDELYESVSENVKQISNNAKTETKKIIKTVVDLGKKIEVASEVVKRFEKLDSTVMEFGNKITSLDVNLSTQIIHYQDEMTQMQHELESGLETLEQTLTNMATNPDDVADLARKLNAVQDEMEISSVKQKDLELFQTRMATELVELYEQLELIREVKADRSEVKDSLCDKAGLEQLNGMVSIDILNACRDDLLNRIKATNDTFETQEEIWQHALDDLLGSIDEKSDWHQLNTLRNDIGRHLNDLQKKVQDLTELIGEPRAVTLSRILFQDTECASCRKPARMEMTAKLPLLPSFKRASADGAEATKQPKGDGDNGVCYLNRPVKRPINTKTHMCRRYCGGSHTMLPAGFPTRRAVPIPHLQRELTATIGTDGFTYKTDEIIEPKPCINCNAPETPPKKNDKPESLRFDPVELSGQQFSMADLWEHY